MTTHKMGRHVFGTVYAPQLPAKTLMEYMGITKFSVVQRYINFSKEEKVNQFEQATKRIVSPGIGPRAKGRETDGISLIERLKALAPKGKERAWAGFLDGLKELFLETEQDSADEHELLISHE